MIKQQWRTFTKPVLSRQLIGLILSLYFGIALTLTAFQLASEFHHEKKNLSSQVAGLGETFRPSVTEALWNYEEEQLYAVIEGLYKNAEVYGVTIHNMDNNVWRLGYYRNSTGQYESDFNSEEMQYFQKRLDLTKAITQIYQFEVPLSKVEEGVSENIGALKIYFSSVTVIERTWMTFLITIIGAILKTVCLWVVSVLVINRIVTHPIAELKSNIDDFDFQSLEYVASDLESEKLKNTNGRTNELNDLKHSYYLFCKALVERNQMVEDYKCNLETKVKERTQSLNEALEDLSVATRVKSDFLATMSHEIRTPMNAVIGSVQLLQKTKLDQSQLKLMKLITYGGKTLMTLIDDILDLSKIEANKLVLESTRLDISELLTRTADIFESNAIERGISLEVKISGPTAPLIVLGDPTRIGQIISNLLSNAIKFTDSGAVILFLDEPIQNDNQLQFKIVVQDTGMGMNEAQQAAIFNAFTQADTSTTREYGGTGLGLAISLRLLEAMGGEINVESAPGLGSKFTITLQLPIAEKCNIRSESEQLPMVANNSDSATILVVDDNDINREIAQCILEEQGYEVLIAKDGLEAVYAVNQNCGDLDLILMDCHMPNMSGIEATEEIRLLEKGGNLKAVPIIALSADAMMEAREKCLAVGMNGFISKPFFENDLLLAIQQHLK
ncbi:MAG: response regulator [Pseudomonadales bacterium]|nr:response regulator [Pseudomonadales bacterium]